MGPPSAATGGEQAGDSREPTLERVRAPLDDEEEVAHARVERRVRGEEEGLDPCIDVAYADIDVQSGGLQRDDRHSTRGDRFHLLPRLPRAQHVGQAAHDRLLLVVGGRWARTLERQIDVGALCVESARGGAVQPQRAAGHDTLDNLLQPLNDAAPARRVVGLGLQCTDHRARFCVKRRRLGRGGRHAHHVRRP